MSNYEAIQKLKEAIKKLEEEDKYYKKIKEIYHYNGDLFFQDEYDSVERVDECNATFNLTERKNRLDKRIIYKFHNVKTYSSVGFTINWFIYNGYKIVPRAVNSDIIFEKC